MNWLEDKYIKNWLEQIKSERTKKILQSKWNYEGGEYNLSVSIEEAEKIATEFVEKKRSPRDVKVIEVTRFNWGLQVNGQYTHPKGGVRLWKVNVGNSKKVREYKIL